MRTVVVTASEAAAAAAATDGPAARHVTVGPFGLGVEYFMEDAGAACSFCRA
jgi:hypothetical protein